MIIQVPVHDFELILKPDDGSIVLKHVVQQNKTTEE
jgi:hypothetical protein